MKIQRRLRFGAAQVGRKSGKAESLGLLLQSEDMPGDGWRTLDERTWRTGVATPHSERSVRGAKIGSVTAWRSFARTGPDLGAWIQIVPFSSRLDAQSAVADVQVSLLPNLRQQVKVVDERVIDGASIQGLETVWALDQTTVIATGPGTTTFVSGASDRFLLIFACSGPSEGWEWSQVEQFVRGKLKSFANRWVELGMRSAPFEQGV